MTPELNRRLERLAREAVATYPFYRTLGHGRVSFSDLPFVDKRTINGNRPSFEHPLLARSAEESFTSGTTGVPFRCLKTRGEKLQLSMALHRERRKWGLPLRHRLLLLSNRFVPEPNSLSYYAEQIRTRRPHMIQGRFSALSALAGHFAERGWEAPEQLLFVQNWGEPVQTGEIAAIENAFGPLVDYYGLEEVWCVAFADRTGRLAVNLADIYPEIVDPSGVAALPPGEWGEIAVTSFVMRSMPFIRYRTGDWGRLVAADPKDGSVYLELLPVRASQIRLRERALPSALLRYLDRFFFELHRERGLQRYQLVQEDYETFRLLLVMDPADPQPIADHLRPLLEQCLGFPVALAAERTETVHRDPVSGKTPAFVSRMPKGRDGE